MTTLLFLGSTTMMSISGVGGPSLLISIRAVDILEELVKNDEACGAVETLLLWFSECRP